MYYNLLITFFSVLSAISCQTETSANADAPAASSIAQSDVVVAADRLDEYLPLVRDKTIALLVNHTSVTGGDHLADRLLAEGIEIKTIFAPEHGFRGTADAGEKIADGKDAKTGVQVTSLYGKKRKPAPEDLAGIDLVLFDIQDVGCRFYTYISTMSLAMEACAENNVPFLVLDRPNPNGHYVDGPIRESGYESFVGMHPVPMVYGMTIGEYAQMVNEEGWLANGVKCELSVIPCANYTHESMYDLPIKPSPNLPNLRSILLYPSLCMFEGTPLSVGRGTTTQFQVIGHPDISDAPYEFTPTPQPGAMNPKLQDQLCHGISFVHMDPTLIFSERQINLDHVIHFFNEFPDKDAFFYENKRFDTLAGTAKLREMIMAGKTAAEIKASWTDDLAKFEVVREKYLIYE